MPSVIGTDNDTPRKGFGVEGTSAGGDGVRGISTSKAHAGVSAINDSGGSAVGANSTTGVAVFANSNSGAAVSAISISGDGVFAQSDTGHGIFASSIQNVGVEGFSGVQDGVRGTSISPAHAGVSALNSGGGDGVQGEGKNGVHGHSVSPTDSGVWGENTGAGYGVSGSTNSGAAAGVWGNNLGSGPGVKGTSTSGDAVIGVSTSNAHAGVSAINDSVGEFRTSFGIWARGTPAGHFQGDIEITDQVKVGGNTDGLLTVLGPRGQISFSSNEGTVLVEGIVAQIVIVRTVQGNPSLAIDTDGIGSNHPMAITALGGLTINSDLTVTGNAKFQGAKQGFLVDEFINCSETVLERGDLLTLRRTEAKERYGDRIPVPQVELAHEAYAVAVCGVVDGPALQSEGRCHDAICAEVPPGARGLMVTIGCYADCKVDADVVPIEVGDLLTTSSTPGHAQKVLDRSQAVGAIVGKALKAVEKGKATIPILVLLH